MVNKGTDFLSRDERDLVEGVKVRKNIDKQEKELKKAKEFLKEKTTIGKVKKGLKKAGKRISENLSARIKPAFKKPQAKGIRKLSAIKLVQQLAKEQGGLVREVEDKFSNPPQDNRSLFFRASFQEEQRKAFGGFL